MSIGDDEGVFVVLANATEILSRPVEPGLIVEIDDIDDQRISLPSTS